MLTYYPVSIAIHSVALNITVQSYNGSLDFGLTACRKALPDLPHLAAHMKAAHDELLALTPQVPDLRLAEPARPAPAKRAKAGAKKAPAKAPAKRAAAKEKPKTSRRVAVPMKLVSGAAPRTVTPRTR
jgi:hypothetical protein